MDSFLSKLYLFRFLEAFKLVGVIFTLLFQHNGLDPFQISLLIGVWSVTQLVLEVPFGTVADKYPRRNVMIVGLILFALGMVLWLQGGFLFYALGFILWGAKNALISGTLEAFVYDELKSYNKEDLYEKVNGKLETWFWAGVTISAAIGGFVASINFQYVILATILSTLVSIGLLLTIRSVRQVHSTGEEKYLSILGKALKEIRGNGHLLYLMILFCVIFSVYGAADEYWPLVYENFGIDLKYVGILVALGYGIFSIAGSSLSVFNKLKIPYIEYLFLILSGVLFIIVGLGKSVTLLPLLFVAFLLFKVAHIKFDVKFQHSIINSRATISSLKSLLFEVIYLGFILGFGFSSTKLGMISVPYVLGALIILFTIIFIFTRVEEKDL